MNGVFEGEPRGPGARRLLLVAPRQELLALLVRTLGRLSLSIQTARSAEEGLQAMEVSPAPVVACDTDLGESTGLDLLRALRKRWPETKGIVLAGGASERSLDEALSAGEVFRVIAHPWCEGHLLATVLSAFEEHETGDENRRLRDVVAQQEEDLKRLTQSLEQRVQERTELLSRGKREWEATFDCIENPIVLLGPGHVVVRANRACAILSGADVKEMVGRTCFDLLFHRKAPCDGCPAVEGQTQAGTAEIRHGRRSFQVSAFPAPPETKEARTVCVYRETTQEHQLRERVSRSEKLAAIGQLAGGVAHELNNPLGAILAFAQMMQRDAGRSEEDLAALADIEQAARRCKRFVDLLLQFGGRGSAELSATDLNRLVADALTELHTRLDSHPGVRLDLRRWPEPILLTVNRAQIQQVVLALLDNAIQSLELGQGRVSVTTRIAGNWAELVVADDGVGIPEEALSRIFEPTFTTKEPGDGSGLGLAIAWSVAVAHGGRIDVRSAKGQGSVFTLKLPLQRDSE